MANPAEIDKGGEDTLPDGRRYRASLPDETSSIEGSEAAAAAANWRSIFFDARPPCPAPLCLFEAKVEKTRIKEEIRLFPDPTCQVQVPVAEPTD
jgi:hypothetical protein